MKKILAMGLLLGALAACDSPQPTAAAPTLPAFDRLPSGQVAWPTRLAATADGTLWVSDAVEGRVAAYRNGRRVATLSGLDRPLGLATDGRTLYVGLAGPGSVEAWDVASGAHVRTVAPAGTIAMPNALALAPDGTLYAVDSRADLVRSWDATGRENPPLGGPGATDGRFRFPVAVAVDSNTVVVADQGNHRLQVFGRDGRWIRSLGGPLPEQADSLDELAGRFARLQGVALDGDRIVALDSAQHLVHVLDRDGRLARFLGRAGSCDRCFGLGTDVAVVAGTVVVADPDHRRWVTLAAAGEVTR